MEIYTNDVAAARTGAAFLGVCSPWMSLSVESVAGASHVRTQNPVLVAGIPGARLGAFWPVPAMTPTAALISGEQPAVNGTRKQNDPQDPHQRRWLRRDGSASRTGTGLDTRPAGEPPKAADPKPGSAARFVLRPGPTTSTTGPSKREGMAPMDWPDASFEAVAVIESYVDKTTEPAARSRPCSTTPMSRSASTCRARRTRNCSSPRRPRTSRRQRPCARAARSGLPAWKARSSGASRGASGAGNCSCAARLCHGSARAGVPARPKWPRRPFTITTSAVARLPGHAATGGRAADKEPRGRVPHTMHTQRSGLEMRTELLARERIRANLQQAEQLRYSRRVRALRRASRLEHRAERRMVAAWRRAAELRMPRKPPATELGTRLTSLHPRGHLGNGSPRWPRSARGDRPGLPDYFGPDRGSMLVPERGPDLVAVEIEDREPEQRPPLPAGVEVPGRLPVPGRGKLLGRGVTSWGPVTAVADAAREPDSLGRLEAHAAALVAPPPAGDPAAAEH